MVWVLMPKPNLVTDLAFFDMILPIDPLSVIESKASCAHAPVKCNGTPDDQVVLIDAVQTRRDKISETWALFV
jgi:hypothetical protein